MYLLNKESYQSSSIMSLSGKKWQLSNLNFFAKRKIFFAQQRVFVLEKLGLKRGFGG